MSRHSLRSTAAFSMIELTLALGVAAFCMIVILGMLAVTLKTQQGGIQQTTSNEVVSQILGTLRAAVRHPGNPSNQLNLQHFPKGGPWDPTPDTVFFTNEGNQQGSTISSSSVYRATINYIFPPTDTTSLADVVISWPAAQTDLTKVAGSVETFIAINR